ncbi:MAG: hypothetical protein JEZ06_15200 [Anaerolineaceae bacterium]|nr:hypothetical protein [Anaerolineaceae bacterium]
MFSHRSGKAALLILILIFFALTISACNLPRIVFVDQSSNPPQQIKSYQEEPGQPEFKKPEFEEPKDKGFEEPMEPERPEQHDNENPQEQNRADLTITDLFPSQMPEGVMYLRIENHGPVPLTGTEIQLQCYAQATNRNNPSDVESPFTEQPVFIQLDVGEALEFDTGIWIDTNKFEYSIMCMFFSEMDLNDNNNQMQLTLP